jgi:hypothetical protein
VFEYNLLSFERWMATFQLRRRDRARNSIFHNGKTSLTTYFLLLNNHFIGNFGVRETVVFTRKSGHGFEPFHDIADMVFYPAQPLGRRDVLYARRSFLSCASCEQEGWSGRSPSCSS